MGVGLGKESSLAGARVGQLGLQGAGQSVALATGADATRNPYSTLLSGVASNPSFNNIVSGGLNAAQAGFSNTALGSSGYGTGLAYSGNSFNTGIILNNGVHIVFGEFSQYNGVNVNDIAFLSPFGTLLNCPYPTPTPTTTPTYTPTPTST